MYGNRYQQPSSYSSSTSSSTIAKTPRCTNKYGLGQTTSISSWDSISSTSITESDLLKYTDLNMDLKELNRLFQDFNKKKTQKNNNLRKLNSFSSGWFRKKQTNSNKKSHRNSIERTYREEQDKFTKNFKKILSEKIRQKTIDRLDKLISNPKEERLNKLACALSALLDVLKSCNVNTSYEDFITKYKTKISKEYQSGLSGAEEFIRDILEKNPTSLADFISKQSIHKKQLGEILKTTIKDLKVCNA